MLKGTKSSVSTQTVYEIPENLVLIQDGSSPAMIRPTAVQIGEKDGEILTISFHGPRQLDGPADARDSGTRVFAMDVERLSDREDRLVSDALMLHLRNTVTVLDEDETREVLARLA